MVQRTAHAVRWQVIVYYIIKKGNIFLVKI